MGIDSLLLPTMWIPEIKLGLSDFASTFTHRVIWTTHNEHFVMFLAGPEIEPETLCMLD